VPGDGGLDARAMLQNPRKGYLLWDIEPEFDLANPTMAMQALRDADRVVAVTAFVGKDLADMADVLLPLAPVPETAGSSVNLDGLRQTFDAALKAPGEARPGWKILRRLGEMLDLDGFDFVDLSPIAAVVADKTTPLAVAAPAAAPSSADADTLWRIGDVPIYAGDSLLRRSRPLQETRHADPVLVRLNPATAEKLGLGEADMLRVSQDQASVDLPWALDARIPPNAVWLPVATCAVNGLADAYGPIRVEALA
jgi:NADH-quinone oxidoreductase subunit G